MKRKYVLDFDEMFRRMRNTFKELQDMQSDLEEEFKGSFPVDMEEEEEKVIVKADMPGVNKENINLKATNNELMISAESREEFKEENEKYIKRERSTKSYSRRLTLPAEVDTDNIEAKYENGVLRIELPKKEKKKKKEVKVK